MKKTPVPLRKTTAKDYVWESMISGIPASEMSKKHNEEIDRKALNENKRALRKMFVEAGCSPEEATKKVAEGKPKIKKKVDPLIEETARRLEKAGYDYATAIKTLENEKKLKAEKEKQMGAESLQRYQAGAGRRGLRAPIGD